MYEYLKVHLNSVNIKLAVKINASIKFLFLMLNLYAIGLLHRLSTIESATFLLMNVVALYVQTLEPKTWQ